MADSYIMDGHYVMEMLNLIRGCPARARRPNEAIPADFARPAVARLRQTQMRGEVHVVANEGGALLV